MKISDLLYGIFMGLIYFLLGGVIIGAVGFLMQTYFIDFLSILLFFFFSKYITHMVMKGIRQPNKFFSILFPIYVVLMYFVEESMIILIRLALSGINILSIIPLIPEYYALRVISIFSFTSGASLLNMIVELLLFVINILIIFIGCRDSYKIAESNRL